jgi:hypothetical protein
MREKIDKAAYRKLYSRRMQRIEPCFSDIENRQGMARFTLRGKKKVVILLKFGFFCNLVMLVHVVFAALFRVT